MASQPTKQTSGIGEQEMHEEDENIPPLGFSDSSPQPSRKMKPLSDTCTFVTPVSKRNTGGVKAKSQMPGLQFAITPSLKCLNIGGKCQSPESLNHGKTQHLNVSFPFVEFEAQCQQLTRSMEQCLESDLLEQEDRLANTILDVTVDSTLLQPNVSIAPPDSQPVTPVAVRNTVGRPEEVVDVNPESDVGSAQSSKSEMSSRGENVTLNFSSFLKASLDGTRDISVEDGSLSSRLSSQLSGQNTGDSSRSVVIQCSAEELSGTFTGNASHTVGSFVDKSSKCTGENMNESSHHRASFEVTRDVSTTDNLGNTKPSLELSGQNTMQAAASITTTESQGTPAKEILGATDTHPVNVTHDLSSSSDRSAQSIVSRSTSDLQCNGESKNLTSHDAEMTDEVPPASSKAPGSLNNTFTAPQATELSTSTDLTTAAQTSSPQNATVDLSPTAARNPAAASEAEDQTRPASADATEAAAVVNHDCSAAEASGSSVVKNNTFNMHSLQKSSGSTILGELGSTTICLHNNTMDLNSVSKIDSTVTLSERSSSVCSQNNLDVPSPSRPGNTSTRSKSNVELHPDGQSELGETAAGAGPNAKNVDPYEGKFEVGSPVVATSGTDRGEAKAHSPSGLPETSGHQSTDTEIDKTNTFNLDDSLDLRADALITSTPMTDCKVFNVAQREEGKTSAAQKKLYGQGPGVPADPAPVPSNIVGDRKTFLTLPAAKSLLPPFKAASQLWKYKPASEHPRRPEPSTSGPPMTRQRAHAEASRDTAAPPQESTGMSSFCVGRAVLTRSKQPTSLRRPQLSGIPSATQRATTGLRLPSARGNAPPSSSGTDKPSGPAAANPVTKTTQTKRHMIRGKAFPVTKKMKMDASLPPSSGEASVSSCEPPGKVKILKPPAIGQRAAPAKTQSHGCAHCGVLEQQLKVKCEEIKRLKEELQKYNKKRSADDNPNVIQNRF